MQIIEQAFSAAKTDLGISPKTEMHINIKNKKSLRHTISLKNNTLTVTISGHIISAPYEAVYALAVILISKIYRKKIDKIYRANYSKFIETLNYQSRLNRIEYQPVGKYYDLSEIFKEVNDEYFSGRHEVENIGWSKNKSYRRLGFFDARRDLLVISCIFDNRKVSREVVAFLVYHELLHKEFPVVKKNGRQKIHTSEFRAMERKFRGFDSIQQTLKKLIPKL